MIQLKKLQNQPEIRLYLPFSIWFGTKRTSVWFQINRKMVNTFWFRFDFVVFHMNLFFQSRPRLKKWFNWKKNYKKKTTAIQFNFPVRHSMKPFNKKIRGIWRAFFALVIFLAKLRSHFDAIQMKRNKFPIYFKRRETNFQFLSNEEKQISDFFQAKRN